RPHGNPLLDPAFQPPEDLANQPALLVLNDPEAVVVQDNGVGGLLAQEVEVPPANQMLVEEVNRSPRRVALPRQAKVVATERLRQFFRR
ncbi:unnamed protein product, partial [Allacma fusca]